ncbi:MAG TPA: hypothetical protein VFI03_03395 [Solirubrobacterales bacterium]|nr:hypothetical protein [Solirubrobacterales bacterium]
MVARLARILIPAAILAVLVLPAPRASATDSCPGGFLVFQPAPAGPVLLGSNSYTIRIYNMSCAFASSQLASFIGHDVLPDPWTANVPTRTFYANGRNLSFFQLEVDRPGATAGGGWPRCPSFSVMHDDNLGEVELPRGQYALRTQGEGALGCLGAARLLVEVLEHPHGDTPAGWTAVDPAGAQPAAIMRHRDGHSVRLRRLHGRVAGGGHAGCESCE